MSRNTEQRERIVDLLKGICILLVCLTHYEWKDSERRILLFSWWVDMAVPVFMVLSGYVYEKTLDRKNIISLSQAYTISDILNRTLRLTIPVLIGYLIVLIWDQYWYNVIRYDIFMNFLRGGRGPGSYYYPVMMQAIFVFPVIGIIIKRQQEKGLLLCLLINAFYEILHVAYCIPENSYRLLMFRYIFAVSAGCYIALDKKVPTAIPSGMFCCGFLFIFAYAFLGYEPVYVIHWTGTSFLASMYIIPIVWSMIRKCSLRFAPIEFLGKASYNIFIVQMVYYYTVAEPVYRRVENRIAQLLISICVCVFAGILFYMVEAPLTRTLQRKLRKFL